MTGISVPPVRVVFDDELRSKILRGIDDCLLRGSVAAGKKVQEFEEFWASYTGCVHAVATSSGGSALELLMRALEVGGREVLVPTNTFIATANAVIAAAGTPVLVDADDRTMGISLAEIKRRCTPKTVGVIVVHIGGIITPEIDAIADWCRAHNLWLVEDAAHAHGSEFKGRRAGTFGVAAAYSFFATKVITSGEGGMIVCRDDKLADACQRYRDYGKKSQWESVHTVISGNHRMSDLTAVVGLEHARRLDGFIEDREQVAQQYDEHLGDILKLVSPAGRSSWYKYLAYLPKHVHRTCFKDALKKMGVSLSGGVYDLPLHQQPVFADRFDRDEYPIAADVCARHICLPIYSEMSVEQVQHVTSSIRSLLAGCASVCLCQSQKVR